MAKERFNRTKPHCNLGIFGDTKHKTALIAAISKVFGPSAPIQKDPSGEKGRGITINTSSIEFETEKRHYTVTIQTNINDFIKNYVTGGIKIDAAIFTVSGTNALSSQDRENILLAQQTGLNKIVVFMDDVDIPIYDITTIKAIGIRNILSEFGFDANKTPFIYGDTNGVLNGVKRWEDEIVKLMKTCDDYFPLPESDKNKPFLMPIEDIFVITGRGTVVTGRVERGIVHIADTVERVGLRETASFLVTGIEMFRKLLDEAQPGDNVGVLLRGAQKTDFARGMVLAAPGSISAYTDFEADIYILTKDEGGRSTPIVKGYRPQFYFRTIDVTGTLQFLGGVDMVKPGSIAKIKVKLLLPIAMEVGTRFVVREGGRSVACGIVTRIPKAPINNSFLMTVKDAFVITGRGTVATGIVDRGTVHVNDRVKNANSLDGDTFAVTSITVGGKTVEQANKGDDVSLLLRGASKEDVSPGSVICAAE